MQLKQKEKKVNSFVTVDREGALKRAEEVQKMIDDGTLTGPLAGVPVAIKDNMCTKDLLTTCSSKILYNFKPTYTAEAVENLEKSRCGDHWKTIWMSLRWEVPQRRPLTGQLRIHGMKLMSRWLFRWFLCSGCSRRMLLCVRF